MRTFAVIAVIAALTTGCVSVQKDDTRHQPTVGQELIDLNKAHEKGLLSDEEFKRERRRILKDNY
jgi:hypothetical protein